MNLTLDRNLFTQMGLDSGSLTMLGTVVHSFAQPGEYRGVVHDGPQVKAVFTISVDNHSADAQVSIDLASLVAGGDAAPPGDDSCCKEATPHSAEPRRFVVNPRGYALFHVSKGAGGFYVHVRRADADQKDMGYDSRALVEGDVFTAIVLRPGMYSIVNQPTGARGELTVSYPKPGDGPCQPPAPVRVVCGAKSFEPARLHTDPGQGVIFECRAPSRIQIRLEKPDDGPNPMQSGQPDRLIKSSAV